MQNKKQALILMLIFIFCWIVGYWLDNYNYYDIGIISLFIPLFIVPVLALRYMRQKKQKDLASINKIFRAFCYFLIVLFSAPMFFKMWYIFYFDTSEGKLNALLENASFFWSSAIELNLFYPYFVIIALFYLVIRIDKKNNSFLK